MTTKCMSVVEFSRLPSVVPCGSDGTILTNRLVMKYFILCATPFQPFRYALSFVAPKSIKRLMEDIQSLDKHLLLEGCLLINHNVGLIRGRAYSMYSSQALPKYQRHKAEQASGEIVWSSQTGGEQGFLETNSFWP